jgi:hypothetical protein
MSDAVTREVAPPSEELDPNDDPLPSLRLSPSLVGRWIHDVEREAGYRPAATTDAPPPENVETIDAWLGDPQPQPIVPRLHDEAAGEELPERTVLMPATPGQGWAPASPPPRSPPQLAVPMVYPQLGVPYATPSTSFAAWPPARPVARSPWAGIPWLLIAFIVSVTTSLALLVVVLMR